mmetsp:Transcript_3613/g.4914  ORF Transcript_3613/g.4914 Transcript_3613/m.4914 type:complete len:217 (-) Transcript_3613:2082-2732(-)
MRNLSNIRFIAIYRRPTPKDGISFTSFLSQSASSNSSRRYHNSRKYCNLSIRVKSGRMRSWFFSNPPSLSSVSSNFLWTSYAVIVAGIVGVSNGTSWSVANCEMEQNLKDNAYNDYEKREDEEEEDEDWSDLPPEDEDTEDECPLCRFMKKSPCGNHFRRWQMCVDRYRESGDFAEKCSKETIGLGRCSETHSLGLFDLIAESDDSSSEDDGKIKE